MVIANNVSCPRCGQPLSRVREDPRGVELPHCCHRFWVPQWKIVNLHLQIHLKWYRPEGFAYESTIVHENEIREFGTPNPALNSHDPVQSSDNPVQSSDEDQHTPSTLQPEIPNNQQPYSHPDLDPKEQVCEYLQLVNDENTASTGEIRESLGLAKSTFKWVSDQLIDEGRIEKVGHGQYRLLT